MNGRNKFLNKKVKKILSYRDKLLMFIHISNNCSESFAIQLTLFFIIIYDFAEEDFTVEEFPEDFIPPPMRDDFVIRDDMSQNNLIQDKGMYCVRFIHFIIFFCKSNQLENKNANIIFQNNDFSPL